MHEATRAQVRYKFRELGVLRLEACGLRLWNRSSGGAKLVAEPHEAIQQKASVFRDCGIAKTEASL